MNVATCICSSQKATVCTLNPVHNHFTNNALALSKKSVCKDTREKLEQLFSQGLSPALALEALKSEYIAQPLALADRSVVPDYKYVSQYVFIAVIIMLIFHILS